MISSTSLSWCENTQKQFCLWRCPFVEDLCFHKTKKKQSSSTLTENKYRPPCNMCLLYAVLIYQTKDTIFGIVKIWSFIRMNNKKYSIEFEQWPCFSFEMILFGIFLTKKFTHIRSNCSFYRVPYFNRICFYSCWECSLEQRDELIRQTYLISRTQWVESFKVPYFLHINWILCVFKLHLKFHLNI